MEEKTIIRERGIAPAGVILCGDTIISGGYYDVENNLITPQIADTSIGRKAYIDQQREFYKQYENRIQSPDVHYISGKKLLVLDYAFEPDVSINYGYGSPSKTGIFYIRGIIDRILGCDNCYYYYKITCNYPGIISRDKFQSIIDTVKPDYVWIIGFDLFNRLPSIIGRGPSLVTQYGHANTFFLEGADSNNNILCLPMPHPKTPGFDSEVEQIWHSVIVELLKQ